MRKSKFKVIAILQTVEADRCWIALLNAKVEADLPCEAMFKNQLTHGIVSRQRDGLIQIVLDRASVLSSLFMRM